jgi:hypothetical protein
MRPVHTQVMHHVGHVQRDIAMGIASDGMPHIQSLLTNLYKNRILAVQREYATNALDAHIEVGNSAPIEVRLPTATDLTFEVQDYGPGLSVDDIELIYSMYGASTKRESDLLTGMLGVGCKSGLTYALQFTVNAVKNGVRTIALVTKDDEGVGVIKILDTAATTDPNGVSIQIPVNAADVQKFRDEAHNLFRFWEPGTVLVDGESPKWEREVDGEDYVWVDADVRVQKRAGYGHNSYVVMGSVPYPFQWPNHDFPYQVVAWVPMGSVKPTPSREELMDVPLTEATLGELRSFILDRLPVKLTEKFEAATSNWSRVKMWEEWRWDNLYKRMNLNAARPADMWTLLKFPRNGFYYRGSEDRAQKYESVSYRDISADGIPLITGYPHRTLVAGSRERIKQFWMDRGLTHRAYFIPDGTEVGILEGRPNVFTWDEIVESTIAPAREKRPGKTQTIYSTFVDGKLESHAGKVDPNGKPLLWAKVADLPVKEDERTRRRWNYQARTTVVDLSKRYPEACWVSLGENQVQKFLRLHPEALEWNDYVAEAETEAVAALSEDDKLSAHPSGVIESLAQALARKNLTASDPDLRKLPRLVGHKSPAIDRCKAIGVKIPAPTSPLADELAKRYPLLLNIFNYYQASRVNVDDLFVYLEAKYILLTAGEEDEGDVDKVA